MSTERHEIRCDVCLRWVPMAQEWGDRVPPSGWRRLIVHVERVEDEVIEICSRMCLARWAVFYGH